MASAVIFVLAAVLAVANAAKIPPTWKVCKRSLPSAEYEKCIGDAVDHAVVELTQQGAPSLGIPPLEPLKISFLEIGKGTGPVAVAMKYEDLKLSNMDSVNIRKIRHKDAEKFKVGVDAVLMKPLVADAKYELEGKVLVLPIRGKGNCHLEFDNFRVSFDITGSPVVKKNITYARVDKIHIKFDTDKVRMKFDNLFDGNKELGDNMNVFLNENWDVILKELRPALIDAFSAVLKSAANQVFLQVPFRELLPP